MRARPHTTQSTLTGGGKVDIASPVVGVQVTAAARAGGGGVHPIGGDQQPAGSGQSITTYIKSKWRNIWIRDVF